MNETKSCPFEKMCPFRNFNGPELSFLLLRLFLGVLFFFAGLGKFMGENGFSFSAYYQKMGGMMKNFAENTFLPEFLLFPYTHVLGYIEIVLGLSILLGLRLKSSLCLYGIILISLGFGLLITKDHDGVAKIAIYLALVAACLNLMPHARLELWKDHCGK